jgi:hypothetical protein
LLSGSAAGRLQMSSSPTHSTDRERLKRFLYDKVENLEQLAILAWLHANGDSLSAEQIARQVLLPIGVTRHALDCLKSRGLVASLPARSEYFRFQAEDAETAELVELLLQAYQRDPASMVALMGSSAIERIRSAAWQTFSECARVVARKQKE